MLFWSAVCSKLDSPVHERYKRAVINAAETDTVLLNRRQKPGLRCLRTPHSEALEWAPHSVFGELGNGQKPYFEGDLEGSIALGGQVAGRIESVRPVREILEEIAAEFHATVAELGRRDTALEAR